VNMHVLVPTVVACLPAMLLDRQPQLAEPLLATEPALASARKQPARGVPAFAHIAWSGRRQRLTAAMKLEVPEVVLLLAAGVAAAEVQCLLHVGTAVGTEPEVETEGEAAEF